MEVRNMHTFSETSPCAHINAARLVQMYEDAGYDAVVITDHYKEYAYFSKNYTRYSGDKSI